MPHRHVLPQFLLAMDPFLHGLNENDDYLHQTGKTGLVGPLDTSIKRIFNDKLREGIERDFESQNVHIRDFTFGAVGQMMTRRVAEFLYNEKTVSGVLASYQSTDLAVRQY